MAAAAEALADMRHWAVDQELSMMEVSVPCCIVKDTCVRVIGCVSQQHAGFDLIACKAPAPTTRAKLDSKSLRR